MGIGTPINSTSFNAALKEITPVDRIEQMVLDSLESDPFFKACTRLEDLGGYQWRLPVATSTNVRVGASFSTAQSLASNTKNSAFLITYNQIYAIASWSGPVLAASSGDKNAFESVVEQEMELAVAALNQKIATQLYRDGTGSITTVSTGASVSAASVAAGLWALPLTNQTDVTLFEVGDVVCTSASSSTGAALRSGTALVVGIDLNGGNLLSSATWSTSLASLAAGDYIYRTSADAANAGANVCLAGFQAWCPASTASLTVSFFGITRNTYQSKLAGIFYNNSTTQDSIVEALVKAVSLVQAAGAKKHVKLIVLHPQEMQKVVNDNSTKIIYQKDAQKDADIGMSNFSLLTDWGAVPICQSIYNTPGYGCIISPSTWFLGTSGKIGVQEVDGIMALRVSTDDAFEARLAAVNIALGCSAPGWNGIVQF